MPFSHKKTYLLLFLLSFILPVTGRAALQPSTEISQDFQALFKKTLRVEGYPFQQELANAAQRYNLPLAYVLAVARGESFFDPQAVSSKGAIGIMQVMPETAADYGISPPGLKDPATNIDVGVHLLADLYAKLQDPYLTLAAYYCGCGGVNKDEFTLRQDCNEYVLYIHSHLQTILANTTQAGEFDEATRKMTVSTFDNFLDASRFQSFIKSKLPDNQFDLFRHELKLSDHKRYSYQIITMVSPSDQVAFCQQLATTTGFNLCDK